MIAREHDGFERALKNYTRTPFQARDDLVDALAAYVAAHDDDGSFSNAWQKARADVGTSREEGRARRMRLIVAAARNARILDESFETGASS